MKGKRILLGMMLVAALLIMAQPSVSNADIYDGAWIANDSEDAFFVEFKNPLRANPDSFFMYDWGNESASMEVFGSGIFQDVFFTPVNGTWYAGRAENAQSLYLGSSLEFGFFFKDGEGSSYFEYDLQVGTGDSYILSHNDINIEVLTHDIQPVPIPASALLLGSGIVGLIGFGKSKRMRK